jgi:hypothetical protein
MVAVSLDFEGLADFEAVSNFYNGGTGGDGSGPGPNLGVTFSPSAMAIIDSDAGGTGNFGGEPSPDTVLFFFSQAGGEATLDFPAGFDTGFSFFYSANNFPGSITVYDGPGATGNILAVLVLPVTPSNGGDPAGDFSPFFPIGVAFTGTAKSVDFAESVDEVGFDNMTLGSVIPSAPTATPTPLTKAQQVCVNEMSKNGEKVNKVQLRENERCLMDLQRQKLGAAMTFDDCMTADRKGKVQKAGARTVTREGKKCDVPPPFAYTNSTAVNKAAVEGALALTYAIFGDPPADLFTKADDKDAAKCQLEMLRRADKLENAVVKEVNKAKKKALKDEAVDSRAALEAKLRAVLSSNKKISRIQKRLVKGVDRKCAAPQAPPDTIFPGDCGDPNLGEVEACVIAAARCEACLKINAFGALNLDCDQADDQNATNGSCQ